VQPSSAPWEGSFFRTSGAEDRRRSSRTQKSAKAVRHVSSHRRRLHPHPWWPRADRVASALERDESIHTRCLGPGCHRPVPGCGGATGCARPVGLLARELGPLTPERRRKEEQIMTKEMRNIGCPPTAYRRVSPDSRGPGWPGHLPSIFTLARTQAGTSRSRIWAGSKRASCMTVRTAWSRSRIPELLWILAFWTAPSSST
jgi:hypothetical protein